MSEEKEYRICTNCVMDTTDPDITFDENGVCNHCRRFETELKQKWFPNKEGKKKLNKIIEQIRNDGKGRNYDCIIGLSGGVDSSYLAYMLRTEYPELRILAVHVDAGWNSELAVQNIQNIVEILEIDLHTEVIDWEEMKDLQRAFLKSSLFNQDIPQDHAFFATLYKVAKKNKIKYFLSGSNIATESILPLKWGSSAMDAIQLKAIHQQFGEKPLKTFPILSFIDKYFYNRYIKGLKVISPLDYVPYEKERAQQIIIEKLNWRDYGGKHHESRFTKFFQSYYQPKKFGFDKRKAHLSSLIVSGQLSREIALKELRKPLYLEAEFQEDFEFIAKKLDFSIEEFKAIIEQPNKFYGDYPNEQVVLEKLQSIRKYIPFLKKKNR
jgi:N-acetyl sugar amidotransferase